MNRDTFFAFLEERKAATMEEATKLAQEERKDESNALKAKANIYDIFQAIWDVAEKLTNDQASFKEVFFGKVEAITSPWTRSLAAAQEHDDINKIVIEEAKLSAVAEIKAYLNAL